MTIRKYPTFLAAFFAAAMALVMILGSLQADSGPQSPASIAELEVVASDLDNPRGLAFGPDGALYIAEAGEGGDGACIPGPDGEQCFGTTGAITKVTFDSEGSPTDQERVVTGMVSLATKDTGSDATGPNDLAFTDAGDLYVLVGLGADPAVRDPAGPFGADGINFGQLVAVDDEGNWSNEVDISIYETTNNPDGAQIDSNPYGLLADGDTFKVVDAGGNDLLNVTMDADAAVQAATADISTLAVFPARMVEFPPGSGEMIPMDAVPTAVEKGPDGAYYVSQLTGFPFPVGGANIYRVVPGEDPEVYQSGFTNVLDLAWSPDGSLLVLEMAKDSLLGEPPPVGQVIQVTPYGARSVLASDGLIAPVDMEIGPDHALYVINFGPMADTGQVVRIPLPSLTTMIPAEKDNTLYESESGALSNGEGQHFFAGVTDVKTGNVIRRGLLAFDLDLALPDDATILSASLQLNMSKTASGDKSVSLHELSMDWGEGASDAGGEEGGGTQALSGDATWQHTFYDTDNWNTAGGDFDAGASATTLVGTVGPYQWSSPQMVADLQNWLDNPDANYGWLLMGDESGGASAKRFDSRENPEAANRPKLTVNYFAPLSDFVSFTPVVAAAE